MRAFKKTAIAVGVAALLSGNIAIAQTAPAEPANEAAVVVVTGQRAALNSAQKLKQNSDEIVDSIVAADIGKLPDRSVTEVLQRVVGVAIDRTMSKGDPEHYSVEGSGVTIRGLTYVRSELNGRDSFSANGGRSLNFEDVPPELMAGVDVYKNPSAEQTEGAVSGLVNLRTAMPFDYKGFKAAISVDTTYSKLKGGKTSPSISGLISNRWKTDLGEFGALVDLAHSESAVRTDAFQVEPYYPRTENGKTVWVPKGAQWRTLEFDREREGAYGALQWKLNNDLRSSVTYFKSRYQMQWDEQAIFAQSNPYNIRVSPDATYDANGALLTGTLTAPADGGINFGDDVRTANRKSDTTDISWNVQWKPSPAWTLTSDLQSIKAKTNSFDSTVATGVQMPKETLDLRGDVPVLSFDAADRAYLADPKNYYWAFTMEHQDRSKADSKAWKGDAKYDFDHPVLRDVRFGVRLTERTSVNENSNPSYNWSPISQPWQLGWNISQLAYLGDPRFSGNTSLHSFDNFFNGKVAVPSLVFPNVSLATGYPASYEALHKYHDILCEEQRVKQGWGSCDPWKAATFGTDPAGINDQSEKTKAVYTQLRFGFDDLKYPIDGNVGVRYVKTDMTARGYTVFTNNAPVIPPGVSVTGVAIPNIPAFSAKQDFDNSYDNVLPSLNLRLKASEKLQFRFAFASALSRPDFSQLQAYTSMTQSASTTTNTAAGTMVVNSVNRSGTASGNPKLTPIKANQFDVTAEWYFAPVGSLTLAVFDKELKDIIVNQVYNYQLPDVTGKMQDFVVTGPVNGAKGSARGFELAYQQTFDQLPGLLSGLGMQANFTFVDSKQKLYNPVFSAYCSSTGGAANLNLNMNGCDTNGQTFGNLPLQGLSRRSFNVALMYDKGPVSSRLAYSWRSKSLQSVNANGTNGSDGTDTNPASPTFGQRNIVWGLPTWADDYGQLDASIFYKINDRMQIGLEATNLTNSVYRQLMDQHIGTKGRAWFVSGPRYTAKMTYSF
ncbi:TonB-dependent receptor [Pseudoduganella namucuonensis]|uniref:TonB-dependent receptor n=1 Tax=Pseudoduganella namucuonensis TaxID=1035707 RepID=A0A1I7GY01_9BURK|nr:TonB-dependent receptor [Pseudoduganella namucuonensis]SFU53321.1 TonB-dependent receptor [Pseudoduganella namucuonensis]